MPTDESRNNQPTDRAHLLLTNFHLLARLCHNFSFPPLIQICTFSRDCHSALEISPAETCKERPHWLTQTLGLCRVLKIEAAQVSHFLHHIPGNLLSQINEHHPIIALIKIPRFHALKLNLRQEITDGSIKNFM